MGLLDRYDLRNRPFGTNTMLSPGNERNTPGGSFGSQSRDIQSSYARASRLLDREARRGNVQAALQSIAVKQDALKGGYRTGGIMNRAEETAGLDTRAGYAGATVAKRNAAMTGDDQFATGLTQPESGVAPALNGDTDKNGIPDMLQSASVAAPEPKLPPAPTYGNEYTQIGDSRVPQGTVNPNATKGTRGIPLNDELAKKKRRGILDRQLP